MSKNLLLCHTKHTTISQKLLLLLLQHPPGAIAHLVQSPIWCNHPPGAITYLVQSPTSCNHPYNPHPGRASTHAHNPLLCQIRDVQALEWTPTHIRPWSGHQHTLSPGVDTSTHFTGGKRAGGGDQPAGEQPFVCVDLAVKIVRTFGTKNGPGLLQLLAGAHGLLRPGAVDRGAPHMTRGRMQGGTTHMKELILKNK